MLSMCVCKLLRHSFRSSQAQWFILLCAHLLAFDLRRQNYTEPVLISWFFGNFIFIKISGLYSKLSFLYVHILPCGSTWGSAFHAVAQPLSMPHSGWLFAQTLFRNIFRKISIFSIFDLFIWISSVKIFRQLFEDFFYKIVILSFLTTRPFKKKFPISSKISKFAKILNSA